MMVIAMDETYYTPEEIAKKLKVHKRTVQRWVAAGTLRAYRLSAQAGSVRVAESDLRKFLEERQSRPPYDPLED